jgi:hypothetical protein
VQQVGLAEAGVAVDGQRVVRLARIFCHGDSGRMGEAVRPTDDEGLKGVLGVEARVLVTPRPESLDISISIAISVWRLDIGNIRPRGRRLRPGIAAKVVLTVLFLAWETLVPKACWLYPFSR